MPTTEPKVAGLTPLQHHRLVMAADRLRVLHVMGQDEESARMLTDDQTALTKVAESLLQSLQGAADALQQLTMDIQEEIHRTEAEGWQEASTALEPFRRRALALRTLLDHHEEIGSPFDRLEVLCDAYGDLAECLYTLEAVIQSKEATE